MRFAPQRSARYLYLRFIRLRGEPRFLARGVFIGLFVGVTPTIPFHTILALLFSVLLRGSKLAAILGTFAASNPLTFFLQYYFSWRIGTWLTGSDMSWDRINGLLEKIIDHSDFMETLRSTAALSGETIFNLLLGGCLLALPIASLGYLLSYLFFASIQRKRQEKHMLK